MPDSSIPDSPIRGSSSSNQNLGAFMLYRLVTVAIALGVSTAAMATETITYTYDAKGRLIRVVHSNPNGVNNGVTTEYTHDKADNRTNVKTAGAPN